LFGEGLGALLLPIGRIAFVGFLGGLAYLHAKVIFGEGRYNRDLFIINQGGGFVGGFANLGLIKESLRICE